MGNSVDQFMTLGPQLISEAAAYAGQPTSDPATDANIRQLMVMASALQTALGAATAAAATKPRAQT